MYRSTCTVHVYEYDVYRSEIRLRNTCIESLVYRQIYCMYITRLYGLWSNTGKKQSRVISSNYKAEEMIAEGHTDL